MNIMELGAIGELVGGAAGDWVVESSSSPKATLAYRSDTQSRACS